MFEFIENTGATNAAIDRLFEILVTPGLGQDKEFYENLFTTPNYIAEWCGDGTVLSNFSYNQLLATYLYYEMRDDLDRHVKPRYTMEYILEETGYGAASSVRRIAKNIRASGALEIIREKMQSSYKIVPQEILRVKKRGVISPIYITLYNELCDNLIGPPETRYRLWTFVNKAKEEGRIPDSPRVCIRRFEQIEERGLCNRRLSILIKQYKPAKAKRKATAPSDYIARHSDEAILSYDEYMKIVKEYRRAGIKVPIDRLLYEEVSSRTGIDVGRVRACVIAKKKEIKNKNNQS